MVRLTRCSRTPATCLAAALLLLAAAGSALALPVKSSVVVNGERISEADIERAIREGAPGLSAQQALESLVAETLVLQEARRANVSGTASYRRELKRWREDRAIGLIGVDELRRAVGRGKPVGFAEFYPRARAAFDKLGEAEYAALDEAVKRRITALHDEARVMIDAAAVRQYALLRDIKPETLRNVVAARTSWGTITLEDIIVEEPKNLGHTTQNTDDVLKMWQQIASQLAARMNVLASAEKAGLFAAPAVKEEDARATRQLLQAAYFEGYFAEHVTGDALVRRIDQGIAGWSREFGLSVEAAVLPGAMRLDAETALSAWRESGKPPAAAEKLTLGEAWPRLTADQKRVVMEQPWRGAVPPLRSGDGYKLLQLAATAPPAGAPTLRGFAESLLRDELRASRIRELLAAADIK